MRLTEADLAKFVGGEMILRDAITDKVSRGLIQRFELDPQWHEDLTIHFEWFAVNDGTRFVDAETWTYTDQKVFCINLAFATADDAGPAGWLDLFQHKVPSQKVILIPATGQHLSLALIRPGKPRPLF